MSREPNEGSDDEHASRDSYRDRDANLATRVRNRSASPRRSKSKQTEPHVAILEESVQHVGFSIISRLDVSSYIPTAFNMFAMLDAMCCSLVENPRLHELCPDFITPALFLYYSHVVYFQILRARTYAGSNISTRVERLLLSRYETVAPIEDWPIAAPLIGFIQAMGAHLSDNPYYSRVIPSLPDFSLLKKNKGLAGLEHVPGMLRLPIVPVFQKFLHNFGNNTTHYNTGTLYPSALPLSDENQFIGISSSNADSPSFLAIAYNLCWKMPAETGCGRAFDDKISAKRVRIRQWDVPDVPDNATLNNRAAFLGLVSSQSLDWMKKLLLIARSANRFFPNSTTLSEIPPWTTLGSLTHVEYSRQPPSTVKDTWYYNRGRLDLSFRGFTNTDDGWLDTRLGIAASPNAEFPYFFPDNVKDANPKRKGPFFVNESNVKENRKRNATFLCEGFNEGDPVRLYSQLIARCFDATGGKKMN